MPLYQPSNQSTPKNYTQLYFVSYVTIPVSHLTKALPVVAEVGNGEFSEESVSIWDAASILDDILSTQRWSNCI